MWGNVVRNETIMMCILLCSCTLVDLFCSRTSEVNSLCVTLWTRTQLRHFQRLTEGAKNASTEEAGTLSYLWGTDLYITLNIKRQYLASVSQTSDSTERGDNDRPSFSRAEEMSPAINGSTYSFNHIFLACRGLIHAWVAIFGGGCTELGSPGCCCLFFIARLFWLVERRSLRLLTFSPALLWICIFMNGAQEGLGELDARQTKKTTEGRRGGKAGGGKKIPI